MGRKAPAAQFATNTKIVAKMWRKCGEIVIFSAPRKLSVVHAPRRRSQAPILHVRVLSCSEKILNGIIG